MTSYSQNDYYYNNENDALSYNSRPISSTNYIKNNSSYGHSTDPMSLKRGGGHQNNSETVNNSMYDNYGSVVASANSGGGGVYGGGLRGGSHYYPNPVNNDNDIYHQQQQQQAYNTDSSYGRGGYYDESCDNMSDYGDNRMSGRHSSMSTTAKQLPQIPMKHSSSMVDGISYARGASLPTTPPVAHKKSRMLPQPTANGGIGGSTGKCLPATPRALPQVNSNNKQSPSARSGTGRKLLPTPKHQQASDHHYDTMSTSSYDNTTINNSYNNVRPHSSIPPASYNDDYNNYGYSSSPTPLHQKRPPKIGNADLSSSLDGSTPVATRDLFDSPTMNNTTNDNFYDTRTGTSELSSSSVVTTASCSSSGNGCNVGSGRKLPKRLPTPNVKQNNGSGGKQLPKLPPIRNKPLSTASPIIAATTDNVTHASSTYNKSYSPYSCTSTSPSMTSTSTSSSSATSNSNHDPDSGYHSSNLYPPSKSDSVSSTTSLNSSGYHSSYLQTSKSPLASSKSSATYSTAVTNFYDDDGNTSLANSYLNNEYHSLKSYPPEITTTSTATVTAAVSATTTTTNKSSSFSVTDYLKKFDIKSALTSSSVSTTKSSAAAVTSSKLCVTCSDSTDCSCFPTSVATTRTITSSLPNGPLSKLSNGPLTYAPSLMPNGLLTEATSITTTPTTTTAVVATTTNYSAYISDYLKIYSSSDFNYEGGATLVDTNVSRKSSISAVVTTTSSTTTTASYLTTYLSGDYSAKSDDLIKTSTPTCDHNGCEDYSSKTYDTIDYFSLAATTTDYSEYLSPAKSTVVNTAMVANGDDYSCYNYLDFDISNSGALTEPTTLADSKSLTTNYDDTSNYSPTPTVTTIASNDDPYSYLDAYKVDLPVYSTDFGSSTESYMADTYTEPNYSTTISQTRLETPSNDFYDDYRSSTATPVSEVNTNFKAYLYETNSNSGSGSGSGSGSSSNAGSDPLLGKHDLTTSSSGTPSSGSTVVPTQQAQISGGYYQPASSKSAPSLNTTSTPQKAASAAANKASSMFGSLSQGLKGGLDGVLSGVAAVADTTKQQQQQTKQQSATSGIKSSAKSFGFGFASKLIPNLTGSSEQAKPTAQTKPTTTAMAAQKPTMTTTTTAPMTTSYDMSYNTNQTTYMNDNQQPYTTTNDYDYSDMEHILTTSSDVSTCGDWNGAVRHSQSIYTTDSLMYDGDFNQGMYETATTTNGGGMMLDDGYDSVLTHQSSLDGTQPAVTTAATMNGGGGKIVDYSDDYKYGYDEYSYSENDYIATGDITDNQNYNNNYDYMDDDATIVSQLLDNAAAKIAAESVTVTTVPQISQAAATLSISFDATSGMDMMDAAAAMQQQTIQVTAAMTTAQQHQQQQQQQQQQQTTAAIVTTAATAQPKLGPTSLLSSLTSVATGGQQPQGQQQQPASKTTSSGGGGLFGSFLGKAAAAVQSASQVVSTATAMTTAAVKVVPGTPFAGGGDQQKNSAQNRHDTEMSNAVSSGAGGAAVVTAATTTSSMDDYENSNLYEDDYYTTSTTTTNTATNANTTNLAPKMLPTVPLSSGKKLPAINGKSGLLMKQQPTEIYDEDEEEYIDELDPNYRMDSEQDDYYMDQTAPSTTASMMAVNGYYTPPDGGYDYREDYFNEEDEYKYLEKEQQLKELRKHQQLMKHQKQPPLEYIEESHDDYIDDNYPSEDSANYLMDDIKDHPLQVPVVTTTSAANTSATTPTSGGLIHHQIKKQDSIIEEDEDEALLTPDDSLQHDDQQKQQQQQQQQFHEESPQIAKKKTLTRGETEEVTSGQLMRKPEITARQRWNWAYNKIIMQLNTHIRELFELRGSSIATAEGLRHISDSVNSHLRSLQTLGSTEQIFDGLLLFLIASKLDAETQSQWEEEAPLNVIPAWCEMSTFLEKRCQTLENMESSLNQNSTMKGGSINNTATKSDTRKVQILNLHTAYLYIL